ncbi:MAG: DedA family protein [Simkaniaceae bacterium]|nr:DedA family protein [Simkaniaceae bacterium]
MSEWIINNSHHAPWVVFFAILLAGLNLPISIDLLLVTIVVLASTLIPESTLTLYLSFLGGCIGAAILAFWMGRLLGPYLPNWRLTKKLLTQERMEKIDAYFQRYGAWTLVIGRFIPFGVRNLIFYSSGMSRMSFIKFLIVDSLACIAWSSLFFFSLMRLSNNFDYLVTHLKWVNITIFSVFCLAVIGVIWYKYTKLKRSR